VGPSAALTAALSVWGTVNWYTGPVSTVLNVSGTLNIGGDGLPLFINDGTVNVYGQADWSGFVNNEETLTLSIP
jgi:hypothetical protein